MKVNSTILKFGAFAVIMVMLTAFLFVIFGQYRTGSTSEYSALFSNASRLKPGDTVRVAGIRVGTVSAVELQKDKKVLVTFDADKSVKLTQGTRALVRYLNLTGDRYMELINDAPGSTKLMSAGTQIPADRTEPALDLDLLLGGLKPVIQGLNPKDVNGLTNALIQILQDQGGTLDSLLSQTSSFSTALADNDQVIQQLIDNLNRLVGNLSKEGDRFRGTVDRLEQLVTGLSQDREPLGQAIEQLDQGTASITDLLATARPPLAGTIDQLNRLAPVLDGDKQRLDLALQRLPDNYRKLIRTGAYGAFVNYYVCGVSFRATDLQGRTVVFPWFQQDSGRCGEPDA